jgi:hypothetical protein
MNVFESRKKHAIGNHNIPPYFPHQFRFADFFFDDSDGRRAEFVAGFKNGAWHIEKGKREYGINKISVFPRFFRDGVCPAGAISKTTPIDQ